MITLYEFALSGNSHKIRLMLSLLKLPYQSVVVNGQQREHKSAEFLAKNQFGQVPVLQDGDEVIRDSQAILVYLARRYGGESWLPLTPAPMAEVCAWLSTAANEVARGPNSLRLHHKFGREINTVEAETVTAALLTVLQTRLSTHDWVAGQHVTIADVAIYPYIALAPEGNVNLAPYPAVTAWLSRVQNLRGYTGMPGMWQA